MPKIPVLSSREVVKALSKYGFKTKRMKGRHICLVKWNKRKRAVVVPNYTEIAKGTLKSILKQAGISLEKLLELTKK